MSSSKLLSLQKLVLIFILIILTGCGSFAPTSFVSSDGIYSAEKAPAETNLLYITKTISKRRKLSLRTNTIMTQL